VEYPLDWDRYSYTRNNPIKYSDPDGQCPAPPEGWGPALCVALFIAPPKVTFGGVGLKGDNRSFGANSDPGASRGYIWVSPDGSKVEPHMNDSTYLLPLGLSDTVEQSDKNTWTVTSSENGYITIEFDLVVAGILDTSGAAPHINGSITFQISADGSIDYAFDRDGFPWAEAYYYDSHGGVEMIFQDPAVRGNPLDLFAIEPNQGLLSKAAQDLLSIWYGPPIGSTESHLE
jgi:hypothetical protein